MKKIIVSSLVVLLIVIISACSSNSKSNSNPNSDSNSNTNTKVNSSSKESFELIIAHDGIDSSSWSKAISKFAELAEEKSDGRLTFKIYGNSQLGSQKQVLESMGLGTVDITYAFEPLSMWVPELNAYNFLYLFKDLDHIREVDSGEVGKKLKGLVVEKAGMRPIMSFMREARQLTSSKPIQSLADLKGMKIRVTQSTAAINAWESLGTKPVPMPMGEVFSALEQGVIDGQENPQSIIFARNIYEVNKYVALTNHQYAPVWVLISESKFQKLPEELQEIVLEAAKEAEAYEAKIAQEEWDTMRETLEAEGVVYTEPDLAPFKEAVKDVYKDFPDLVPYVEEIMNTD
jgi:TRAP-type transport system periplasmic protein